MEIKYAKVEAAMKRARLWVLMLLFGLVAPTRAYEVETHEELSGFAAETSVLVASLPKLGLRTLALGDERQRFMGSEATPRTILGLVRFGSRYEDNLGLVQQYFQPLRHFYDPVYDKALDLGGSVGTTQSTKSPDWAVEDVQSFDEQSFSLRDAYGYLFNALTDPRPSVRSANFGLYFQTIGHVVHHLQDMAQPQHVRNDPHCDNTACQKVSSLLGLRTLYSPSMYEKYTNLDDPQNPVRSHLPYGGAASAPVYSSGRVDPAFLQARNFWRTTAVGDDISRGKGIAEFTNRNFHSAGTIAKYALPYVDTVESFESSAYVDIKSLLPGTSLSGYLRFWSSTVNDEVSGVVSTNPRALSAGIFEKELAPLYATDGFRSGVFTLNRFTFDAAHQFLIPRAVGYSAGLINFMLRGEMEISLPDEGVYGIVDHTVENRPDVDGFGKIKLKLRNVTPGGVDEAGLPGVERIPDGSGGTVVAVVKFHRNTCYAPDLSGEYGSPGVSAARCRAEGEDIVVSQPQPVPRGINDDPVGMTFNFPRKVPINATDVFLQVVYRGPLGAESDAVIVATKDIAEPMFFLHYSTWDQWMYPNYPGMGEGHNTFEQWCLQGFPSYQACQVAHGPTLKLRFADAAGYTVTPTVSPVEPDSWEPQAYEAPIQPVATMIAPVGSYARLALLADGSARPSVFVYEMATPTPYFKWMPMVLTGNFNQYEPETNVINSSTAYGMARGIYAAVGQAAELNAGTAPSIPPLVPSASLINF